MSVFINDNPIVSNKDIDVSYPSISGLMGRLGLNVTTRALQSDNFVTGSSGAGWQLTAEGNLEATSGTFRGAISGSTIAIGTDAWHVDSSGNMWWGSSATYAGATIKISSVGSVDFTTGTFSGTLSAPGGTIGGFTISATTLTATGISIGSNAVITGVTLNTGTSGSRMNLNASTLQFYTSADAIFMTISNGNSEIDITHQGSAAAAIDIDYAATGARGTNLIHLQDANQVSGASTDSTVLYVDRTSASTSAKNLVDIFNAGGTGVPLEIRQNSTATVAALRIYQQDVSETAVFIGTSTAATEADIGLLEVIPVTAGTVGIYIAPAANVAHMRWFAGSAPASPVDGDFWFDGTNLKFRDDTTTRTISWT